MQIPDSCFEELSIQPVTKSLIEHLLSFQPLTNEEARSFGVDTQKHYSVLQAIVLDACQEIEVVEDEIEQGYCLQRMHQVFGDLDSTRDSSDKLNRLMYRYVPGYVGYVAFHTTQDLLKARRDTVS